MWHKIKVLLWKSLQIRKTYWFSSILEILLPCVLFYALIWYLHTAPSTLKFSLNNNEVVVNETIPIPVSEQDLYQDFIDKFSNPGYFIYTPSTKEAENIMKIVANKLKISPKNIETVNNEYEMATKFQKRFIEFNDTHHSIGDLTMGYGIVFEEITKTSVFKYKIKNTQNGWDTNILFPVKEIPGPGNSGDLYLRSGFLALQLALDKAFIASSLSDDHIPSINDYNLKIQSYPYAKYSMKQESSIADFLVLILCYVTLIGFLFMCTKTIKIVADEKNSGINELMKMMGLKPWMLWTGWILHNFFLYSIPITIITYMSCIRTEKLLNCINPLFFWIFLAMYVVAGTYFCFAICSLIHRPIIAIMVGMLVWIFFYSLSEMISVKSGIIKTLFMLHPNGVLKSAYTLFITGKGEGNDSFGFILFMLIINCLLYGFIAWYLESVMPGKYGVAKPLNFLWSKRKTKSDIIVPLSIRNSRLFEQPQNEYKVGIKIYNLYKKFGNFNAVNGVNLDLYKGQITALLGHNGAGKTTTMSIITGLIAPTSGSVKVNEIDIFSNSDYFKSNLGLCPQHNLLFSYLTTLDHLIFFGMLKGMPLKKAKLDGLHLLNLLNILQKKKNVVKDLSGGMKRKVSLAIALIGDPEILILDEPTSGMDPESRREMWDLLLSLRGERTILITTHFMEEADVLGDRIAIMNHGKIICYGTTLFLKKAYGTGYSLNILKEESCKESNLLESIKKIVPEAEVHSSLTAQIVINLPDDKTDQFPDLFKMLEANRKELCIKGLGLSCTTMEEVFLKADSTEHNVEDVSSVEDDFQLFITKQIDCNVDEVTNFVQQYIPECILVSNTEVYIMYNLPASKRNQFETLFNALEVQKQNFKINSFKITSPTTGDVYRNLSTAGDEQKQPYNNDITQTLTTRSPSKLVLYINQFKGLLIKKILYTYRGWMSTLLYGIASILMCYFVMLQMNYIMKPENYPPLTLALKTYQDSTVYYRIGDDHGQNLEPTVAAISKSNGANVIETLSDHNIINDLLKMCTEDVFKYRTELLIAGDFNQTNLTILYNSIAIHTPAVAINLYTNALLQKLSEKTSTSISTSNEPIDLSKTTACSPLMIYQIKSIWIISFIPNFLILAAIFINLPLNERVSGFKQLQFMTKLSPIMYWATCFIWDYFCYAIVIICSLIVMHFADEHNIFTNSSALYALSTLLFVYGWSLIFYTYVYSYFYKTLYSAFLVFLLINFIIGIILSIIIIFSGVREFLNEENPFSIWNLIWYVVLSIPQFSFSLCINGFLVITWNNNICKLCETAEMCSDSANRKPQSYFVFKTEENKDAILEETLILLLSSILYIAIILLFDYKIFARLYQCGFNTVVGTGDIYKDDNEDPDIGAERVKVEEAKSRPNDVISPLLVVDGLVKKFSYSFTAVRGISFAVSPGECFGLLGVNGAGKTTTFRMLTGDTFPSKGDAFIQTDKVYKLSSNINEYVTMIGYCPQFDAINGKLTARESLKLIAILRGISSADSNKHVDKWINLLGLNEYKDRLCGNYSGGNKRKLNTAMALIGDPPVVFLDEPTSGVDPASRRNLWQLLAASQKGGQAVVLTSHSMDECEALCNRLTIMVDGVMKCIGNIQYLKNRYGQGFTVMIKLRDLEYMKLNSLKADFEHRFASDIVLKDEHKGLLHYHIANPNIPLSEIFSQMKLIKQNFSEVEDYTVSDTTLEQVFIAFAKKQAVRQTLE